jgi:hypothetical protein
MRVRVSGATVGPSILKAAAGVAGGPSETGGRAREAWAYGLAAPPPHLLLLKHSCHHRVLLQEHSHLPIHGAASHGAGSHRAGRAALIAALVAALAIAVGALSTTGAGPLLLPLVSVATVATVATVAAVSAAGIIPADTHAAGAGESDLARPARGGVGVGVRAQARECSRSVAMRRKGHCEAAACRDDARDGGEARLHCCAGADYVLRGHTGDEQLKLVRRRLGGGRGDRGARHGRGHPHGRARAGAKALRAVACNSPSGGGSGGGGGGGGG